MSAAFFLTVSTTKRATARTLGETRASQSTLARYPRVGAAIASSRDAAAHEWDQYQSGVFTHELLSALRGAADINGDRRVEYSELAAFLAAANREVKDPRARLQAIVRPPAAAVPHRSADADTAGPVRAPWPPSRFSSDRNLRRCYPRRRPGRAAVG